MAKPSLALVIGKMGKPGGDDGEHDNAPESSPEMDSDSPHVDAAHEILDAMKAGSAEKLSEALKVFYDLCKSEDHGEEY